MALDRFEDGEFPMNLQGSFRTGCYRGHAYCFRFQKFKGVKVYVKWSEKQTELVYSNGYTEFAVLERVARSKIDLYIKVREQQEKRADALDAFTRQCRDYRPGGFCHRHPPYRCATCSCKGKHDFLWDYDEQHGLMHPFG